MTPTNQVRIFELQNTAAVAKLLEDAELCRRLATVSPELEKVVEVMTLASVREAEAASLQPLLLAIRRLDELLTMIVVNGKGQQEIWNRQHPKTSP